MVFKKKNKNIRTPKIEDSEGEYLFRRSRTLTGATSNQVEVVAKSTANLKTDRLKAHESKRRYRRILRTFVLVGVCLSFVLFLASNFIYNPAIEVTSSATKGRANPSIDSYRQAIFDYFADHPLQRFGITLSEESINQSLKSRFSEISKVKLDRSWTGGDVSFELEFRRPILVWQTPVVKYYVDGEGIGFEYNHYKEPKLAVDDKSGVEPGQDGAVASGRFIEFLGQLVGAVDSYKLGRVRSIIIPKSTRQIDLRLTGRDYIIKTHIDRDPAFQAEDIANALKYLDKKKIKPRYLDVRVAHKAFYK